jgi:SARP family transcriptional regulator, regulator of embCAB operon
MAKTQRSRTSDSIEPLKVSAFGGLSFSYRGQPVSIEWESQKARLLFCYLLATYDQWVHRDKLVALLWPDSDEEGSVNNFKTTLSRLRKSFTGSNVLNPVLTQAEAVRINVNAVSLDASLFRSKATTGIKLFARGDVKAAKVLLEEAQDIYAGDFFPEEPFNPFLTATRAELSELNSAVVITLGKIYQQEGNNDGQEAMSLLLRAIPSAI